MSIIQGFFKYIKDIFHGGLQEQLDILVPIAKGMVALVEKDPSCLTNSSKRDLAIASIITELTTKEIAYMPRLVSLAVEIAVVDFKGLK